MDVEFQTANIGLMFTCANVQAPAYNPVVAVSERFMFRPALMCAQVPEHVQRGYEKAQAAVALRKANEAAVSPGKDADSELLAAYMAYTKLEEAQGDPARVQVPPCCSAVALKAKTCAQADRSLPRSGPNLWPLRSCRLSDCAAERWFPQGQQSLTVLTVWNSLRRLSLHTR